MAVILRIGYLDRSDDCDGVYGRNTETALKDFQRDHVDGDYEGQNVVDGLVGIQTKTALWRKASGYLQSYGAIRPEE